MRRVCTAVAAVVLVSLVAPVLSQQVKVTIEPQMDAQFKLTGNYLARATVAGAPTARQVVFRLNFPTQYTLNTAASDIQIVAVVPGADAMSIDADDPPDGTAETPVVFAEAVAGTPANGIWIVALMKDDAQANPKHVCDIIFTARGRQTAAAIGYETGSVSVKDGSLQVLASTGVLGDVNGIREAAQVSLGFGDLDWNGIIDADDFGIFLAAWSEAVADKTDKALADLNPLTNPAEINPDNMFTAGQGPGAGEIDPDDFGDFLFVWSEYVRTHTASATAIVKEGSN